MVKLGGERGHKGKNQTNRALSEPPKHLGEGKKREKRKSGCMEKLKGDQHK